jgi:uncharacterized protein YbbC (DUF1343 family)
VVANQTSIVNVQTVYQKGEVEVLKHTDRHLVDFLVSQNIIIKTVFSPEHGFRGEADAGEKVVSGVDSQTGLPIVSLYGSHKKPTSTDLKGIDVVIFDIQDVGARFYTYISTLHYVMEACAENNVDLIVLDRPNPNGHYVDGPVLKPKFKSFVGMHPVPVVHGLTVGEYAQMINGEGWLNDSLSCSLTVISCEGWDHTKFYQLPEKPSPNLPNMTAIYLYPSLCFFEGTVVSVGRGTDKPFQVIGHPNFDDKTFAFTPKPVKGAKSPKLKGTKCYGIDFTQIGIDSIRAQKQINLHWLILFYKKLNLGSEFFLKNNFFDLLAGSDTLRHQIIQGISEEEIRLSWQKDLKSYLNTRQKYLLYKDF